MGKHIDVVPEETMNVLQNWNWPGNIRELENMIERMVILSKGRVLAAPPVELDGAAGVSDDNLTEMEREHIIRVLRETNGVLSGTDGAASRLGIKRTTLQSMLKRFGIELQDYRRGTERSVQLRTGSLRIEIPTFAKTRQGGATFLLRRRLYFFRTSRRRSWGRAMTV